MPLLLFCLIAVFAYFYFKAKIKHLPEDKQQAATKKWMLGSGLVLLAFLAFTRGQVVVGAIASLFALVMRGLPLLKYFPIFKKLFDQVSEKPNRQNQSTTNQAMTRQQAADILGISEGASEEDIIAAHKRLIQKNHPDKGGSEMLAAQINQARKVLLGLD